MVSAFDVGVEWLERVVMKAILLMCAGVVVFFGFLVWSVMSAGTLPEEARTLWFTLPAILLFLGGFLYIDSRDAIRR